MCPKEIQESSENNLYTLGVIIYLLKAFDAVNHSLIAIKIEIYGIQGKKIKRLESYLRNRKQYIQIEDENKTDFLSIKCAVPQGPISEPLPFLLYGNDLPSTSKILDAVMFADYTNLFFLNWDILLLFATVNSELSKIRQWFLAKKISLNIKGTKYSFFHKTSKKDDVPLKFLNLEVNNYNIERIPSIEFLEELLDENLLLKSQIKYTENKIS